MMYKYGALAEMAYARLLFFKAFDPEPCHYSLQAKKDVPSKKAIFSEGIKAFLQEVQFSLKGVAGQAF